MSNLSRFAISALEFKTALWHASGNLRNRGGRAPRFGLAISGGVDSMALAYLFRRYADELKLDLFAFDAFIVDHKARKNSTEEARRIADTLTLLLKKSPSILDLSWPKGVNPSDLSNFESLARKKRYKALANACRQNSVTHLLLAHHADDNAELVLDRISGRHRSKGLSGMRASAQLPETVGMHSVYESGMSGKANLGHGDLTAIESGGVLGTRPLLNFPKDRLIATCLDAGVSWAEDATNHDPTFTRRNAIRSIMRNSTLPRALSVESLTKLAEDCREENSRHQQEAKRIWSACRIRYFDPAIGTLSIEIPVSLNFLGLEPILSRAVALEFSRQLCDTVTFKENVKLPNFSLPEMLFPVDYQPSVNERKNCTVAGTMLVRRSFKSGRHDNFPKGNMEYARWEVCRQPFSRREKVPVSFFLGNDSAVTTPSRDKLEAWNWTRLQEPDLVREDFSLWDGRYWIAIEHTFPHPVAVVPLDMMMHEQSYSWSGAFKDHNFAEVVQKLLKFRTSPHNRWSLPAVVIPPGVDCAHAGKVIALPSLGLVTEDQKDKLSWDIRYKNVPTSRLLDVDRLRQRIVVKYRTYK